MTTDLSHRHDLVGHLFDESIGEDPARFALTSAQVSFFEEHGYVSGIRALDDHQIEALRAELADFVTPDHAGRDLWHEYHANESVDPDKILFHALGAWRLRPAFHDLLWNPAIAVPASQLLDGAARLWHDQLFCKPAMHGGVVAWHQDYSYWTRTKPLAHLTCWIALDESTRDNGCVMYVPGSHTWDLLPITGLAGDMDAIREVLDDEQWAAMQNPVAIELQPGECTFHHPTLVHGSHTNTTDRPRRATVVNFIRDGVCSVSDEPLLKGCDPAPNGQPLGGRFHPVLHDPASP
jgi:ectoine hydroxylase-related dioxygenase (phytanoyl-CoA dioxygenase family)